MHTYETHNIRTNEQTNKPSLSISSHSSKSHQALSPRIASGTAFRNQDSTVFLWRKARAGTEGGWKAVDACMHGRECSKNSNSLRIPYTYIHAYIPLPVSCRIAVCVFSRLCCDDDDDDDILRRFETFYIAYIAYTKRKLKNEMKSR